MADADLRILMVNHLPLDRRLGGSRPQIEIADLLRGQGHHVDHYSLDDAFPDPPRTTLGALVRRRFASVAVPYIASLASSYDVIDANQGDLPASKARLGFEGRLVVRSNGLVPLYDEFKRSAAVRWPDAPRGHPVRRTIGALRGPRAIAAVRESFEVADAAVVTNAAEAAYLSEWLAPSPPVSIIPLGLQPAFLDEVAPSPRMVADRLDSPRVVAIGTWDLRKGARDWPSIARRVLATVPEATFMFIGTQVSRDRVLADLGAALASRTTVVSTYEPAELPGLLSTATVAASPSYLDSFGLGVLEALAAGVPCAAYASPGPRETLTAMPAGSLIPVGDEVGIAETLSRWLQLRADNYASLARRARAHAERYTWSATASSTLAIYRGA